MDHPRPGLRYVDAGDLDTTQFKFDGLECDSGSYEVKINHPQLGNASVEVALGTSQYVDNIQLTG